MLRKFLAFLAVIAIVPFLVPHLRAQGIKAEYTERNGARAIGMGHAFTGVAEGMPTVIWNPAGLVSISRTEFYFSRYQGFSFTVSDMSGAETTDQISFNFFNFGMPIKDIGVVAFSMNLWDLGSSEIVGPGQNLAGIDNQSLWMTYGSFATRLNKKIDLGVSMKYIREKLSSSQGGIGTSVSLDLGALYRPLEDIPLQFGAALLDLGPNMQFNNENQSDRLPRRIRVGAGYNILKHLLEQDRFNLLLAADYERFLVGNPANTGLFIGTEFSIEPLEDMLLALRSGYMSEEGDLNGALIGFGVNWHGFSFDIARELGVNPLSDRTFYSFSGHF
ncbi:MAG TPA: PorV/PorQ family protein [Candidatus Glassbacteria bacterium]|nr:PorV/PorQ family protein [Candidatus Glassbacteria bacterium]